MNCNTGLIPCKKREKWPVWSMSITIEIISARIKESVHGQMFLESCHYLSQCRCCNNRNCCIFFRVSTSSALWTGTEQWQRFWPVKLWHAQKVIKWLYSNTSIQSSLEYYFWSLELIIFIYFFTFLVKTFFQARSVVPGETFGDCFAVEFSWG